MPRYQLRSPTPIRVVPRRVRRQNPATTPAVGSREEIVQDGQEIVEIEEVEEGSKSPDMPKSSPSVGAALDGGDSDSEVEAEFKPPPARSSATVAPASSAAAISSTGAVVSTLPASSTGTSTLAAPSQSRQPSVVTSAAPAASSAATTTTTSALSSPSPSPSAAFTRSISSAGNAADGAPQNTISQPSSSSAPSVATTTTSSAALTTTNSAPRTSTASSVASQRSSATVAVPSASSTPSQRPPTPAQPENGERESPKRVPHEEPTMITKGAAAAAITLSIVGAIVLIAVAVIFLKRRKRRQNRYRQRVADDAFNPTNTGSLSAPEVVHVASDLPFYGGGGSHFTRTTERSNTLFGPGPYERPETVSTQRNNSRYPQSNGVVPALPTPNPFADPPLNKAYDVLAGRPRSTTLTDRGSWIKNPFKNPESERFDPFGELQAKARRERERQMDGARREAELARREEFAKKEKMGLAPPERKGSDATIEGLGVLDRKGGGMN